MRHHTFTSRVTCVSHESKQGPSVTPTGEAKRDLQKWLFTFYWLSTLNDVQWQCLTRSPRLSIIVVMLCWKTRYDDLKGPIGCKHKMLGYEEWCSTGKFRRHKGVAMHVIHETMHRFSPMHGLRSTDLPFRLQDLASFSIKIDSSHNNPI